MTIGGSPPSALPYHAYSRRCPPATTKGITHSCTAAEPRPGSTPCISSRCFSSQQASYSISSKKSPIAGRSEVAERSQGYAEREQRRLQPAHTEQRGPGRRSLLAARDRALAAEVSRVVGRDGSRGNGEFRGLPAHGDQRRAGGLGAFRLRQDA